LGLFVTTVVLMGADLVADALGASGAVHVALEAGVMLAGLVGAGAFLGQWRRELAAADALRARLVELDAAALAWQEEASRWQREAQGAAAGLVRAIDRQFERWGLSQAEREVGLLLLKGLALKELAELRGTSERTVRQQAQAIYRKGGLAGRAELAAWFLEDLLA